MSASGAERTGTVKCIDGGAAMSEEAEPEEQSTMAQEKEEDGQVGFEAMGRNPDTNSAEYALPAAREVLFGE